ncbi:hypothetical protein A3A05_01545 [Candidatus Nomurabacteria bacterium RIFCSPLOWO2_01_FULL_41_12]|uniref:M23ase beta-sheet core domain-containing protein n=1 Tax=Candidatus Nomurabacteria bacterium RIFCSPLOWO2_01_FULL_41_12 TaxID=1801774 RepID=A0A1F6WW15_9BACT|nr:MAG: hypothetical protein A2732_01510 [Candidatus Nomurabacteria bacterium RIFCSPHIGHO2_01_FULL_40_10]OGI86081.1 MAG: hypothetical protein A3A05_01545 [Candidatus Nomurabacteria bacterium RIFCSPLOWO2_01_FULL_41_12]
MKPYPACKKQFNILVLIILLIIPIGFSYAETAEELQTKISQKDSDIAKLEEEIKTYQAELDNLGEQKSSLSSAIKQLDLTRKKLVTDIAVTQKKIDKTNLKIQSLSFDIKSKQSIITNNIESIKLEIRKTNEFELENILETILSENDFTTIWNDIDNIVSLREKIRKEIVKLKEIKGELEDTRKETVGAKNELVALKSRLSDQQKIVVQNTNEKNKLLKETKNNEANYQKLLKTQLAKKEAFEKELRDYESQLKFILDPAQLPDSGILSWPLDKIFVTQEFGAKTGPHRTYTSGHSGTDFRAKTPLPVKAMADGVVKGVGNTDSNCSGVSFGKWIFIEYNNGLSSAYGHLSLIKVKEGQKVSRGEVVGYTGGTGRVTGPHLHVSLYVSGAVSVSTVPSKSCPGRVLKQPIAAINAYLDPMYYLPRL